MLYVKNLHKSYIVGNKEYPVLKGVSFQIAKGEFVAVMGPSGSGKSTLLNCISCYIPFDKGEITLGGTQLTNLSETELAKVRNEKLGFVFQDFNLLDTLTIEENIILAMSLHGKKKKETDEKVNGILKTLGIEEIRDKFPDQVSGGQKQRCACARALINEPRLILADEPTGALDSRSAQMLLSTFCRMNEELGATILMVTHDAFSASYCKRILFLKDGEIFNELIRGKKSRREFLNEILDVLALTGGDSDYVK